MRKKAVLFPVALGALAVAVLGAVRWRGIVTRFQVLRLAGNAALQDQWMARPDETIEGKAARTYFRERPDELVRKFFRTVRRVCEMQHQPPHPEFEDLEGQDSMSISARQQAPGEVHRWPVSL